MAAPAKVVNETVVSCDECPYGDIQRNKMDPEYFWVAWCRERHRVIKDIPGQLGDNIPEIDIPDWCELSDASQ